MGAPAPSGGMGMMGGVMAGMAGGLVGGMVGNQIAKAMDGGDDDKKGGDDGQNDDDFEDDYYERDARDAPTPPSMQENRATPGGSYDRIYGDDPTSSLGGAKPK